MSRRLLSTLGLLVSMLLAPTVSRAQGAAPEVPAGYETGWHIVRPGETLEGLAARYLGSAGAWAQIQRLNPRIEDPNRIEPGQRVRILVRRGTLPMAKLNRLSRQVEEQPSPIPWFAAQVDDLLVERDGVRTYAKSSADLRFTDGTRLLVTEDSLVFLRRTGGMLQGIEKKSVEIVEGQADLESGPSPGRSAGAPRPEVEIVLGNARATSRPDSSGGVQARARRPTEGGSKVMVYGGDGEVESGGAKVAVPQGMGTSVPQQGPPSPPEKLLPAPRATAPAASAEVACLTPLFTWEPVPEADSYIVEVCGDPGCGVLVERATEIKAAEWRPATPLPLGAFHWRVTARGRSGLDGYPGEPGTVSILPQVASLPPLEGGTLRIVGTQADIEGRTFVNGEVRLEVAAADGTVAESPGQVAIDGREAGAWPTAWPAGEHTVSAAAAADPCGQSPSFKLAPVTFVVDDTPPSLRWEAGDRKSFAGRLTPPEMVLRSRKSDRRRDEGRNTPLTWSTGGVRWFPLAVSGKEEAAGLLGTVEIASDSPELFLRTRGLKLAANGTDVPLGEDDLLWISAEDTGSRVQSLTLTTRVTPAGTILEAVAVDLVGNSSRVEWLLR